MKKLLLSTASILLISSMCHAISYNDSGNRLCDSQFVRDDLYSSLKNNSGVLQKARVKLDKYNEVSFDDAVTVKFLYVVCSGNSTLILNDDFQEALQQFTLAKNAGAINIKSSGKVFVTTCLREVQGDFGKWNSTGQEQFNGLVPANGNRVRYINCQTQGL